MKVGRNDPCPCGSGKKYKKCCLNKPAPRQANTGGQDIRALKAQLEGLTTRQIIENIQRAGLQLDEQIFIETLEAVASAEQLFKNWEEQLQLEEGQLPPAFYESILILAKRLAPEKMLLEDLRDLMQDGYSLLDGTPDEDGLFIWWKFWKDVQAWAADAQIISIEQLDAATKSLLPTLASKWVLDFNKALAEAGREDQRFIRMRYVFADDFLNRFPQSGETMKDQMLIAREETAVYRVES